MPVCYFAYSGEYGCKVIPRSGAKHTMPEQPESLKSRSLTLALLAWGIFVNLAYYWHLAQAYGPQFIERLQSLLP